MKRKTQAERGRELLKMQFPSFNYLDYENSLSTNLNFYSIEIPYGKKKDWCIEYWDEQDKNVNGLGRVDEFYFSTVGALVHMVFYRNIALHEEHMSYIETKYKQLIAMFASKKEEKVEQPKHEKVVQDKSGDYIGEIESFIDDFQHGKVNDVKEYLTNVDVKPHEAKKIAEWFKKRIDELNSIETDESLQEAYSWMGKRELKKYRDYINLIYDTCMFFAALKKERKPRKTKPKPPSFVVKKVQYLKECPDLKLKSLHPEKLVDTESIWVYNVKLRRLYRYIALSGKKLTIKGTTILNFDPDKSGSKIIRKPLEQMAGATEMTIRPLNKLYNDIKATEGKAVGRLNSDTLIVGCFK